MFTKLKCSLGFRLQNKVKTCGYEVWRVCTLHIIYSPILHLYSVPRHRIKDTLSKFLTGTINSHHKRLLRKSSGLTTISLYFKSLNKWSMKAAALCPGISRFTIKRNIIFPSLMNRLSVHCWRACFIVAKNDYAIAFIK